MSNIKILTIIGARPQIIKAATLSRRIKNHYSSIVEEVLVHTGQHYDENMSGVFFKDMDIPKPKYNLGLGGISQSTMTGRMMVSLEEVCLKEKPDWILVYGDTNSTLAGSLVASKLHIKLAHVEAGLRSHNMNMPEEVNRILTDRISNLLFCPSALAVNNLKTEGFNNFPNAKIKNVGDIMYEGAIHFSKQSKKPSEFNNLNLENFVLATLHRAETTDNLKNLKSVIEALNTINESSPVIVPMHPRTRSIINDKNLNISFQMINPVGYLEMIWLIQNCSLVITDSGGLQKEAYFFEKCCLTTRTETEWVELVESGNNVLVGYEVNKILSAFNAPRKFNPSGNLYGHDKTSELIINALIATK
jgi:UDP-GlcNAc3NAcA epimerase